MKDELLLVQNFKKTIFYIEKIIDNFPRSEKVLKDKIKSTNFDILDENRTVDQNKLYSRAVIYNIDENNKTVKQDWQYGKERGKELYSSFVSDVDYLGENHYLIDFGGQYKDDNGTVYDHIYTDAKIKNASNKTTTLIEILNDKVIFEAILYGNSNSNSYKAERKDIYQGI